MRDEQGKRALHDDINDAGNADDFDEPLNEFEALQQERENEFLQYLFQPLAELPEDVALAVQSDMTDRVRQTVSAT